MPLPPPLIAFSEPGVAGTKQGRAKLVGVGRRHSCPSLERPVEPETLFEPILHGT